MFVPYSERKLPKENDSRFKSGGQIFFVYHLILFRVPVIGYWLRVEVTPWTVHHHSLNWVSSHNSYRKMGRQTRQFSFFWYSIALHHISCISSSHRRPRNLFLPAFHRQSLFLEGHLAQDQTQTCNTINTQRKHSSAADTVGKLLTFTRFSNFALNRTLLFIQIITREMENNHFPERIIGGRKSTRCHLVP